MTKDEFLVAYYPGASDGITNKYPAPLKVFETYSDDDEYGTTSTLTIKFILVNALPHKASILISYPEQL